MTKRPSTASARAGATLVLVLAALLLAWQGRVTGAAAQDLDDEVSVEVFTDALAEDGEWIEHPRYGRVWYPRDVDVDWRPYSVGRWVYTDEYGYVWDSEERWGWATYHYGRWDFEPRYGWIWIPGNRWGPAWVEWRTGNGYIGWAPLTPAAVWRDDRIVYLERVDYTAPRWRPFWVFVSEPLFIRPNIHRYCEPPARNIRFVNNTTVITNYTTTNRFIVNRSVDIRRIERVTNQPVVRVSLTTVTTPAARFDQRSQPNTVAIYRPALGRPKAEGAALQAQGVPADRQPRPGFVPGQGQGGPGGPPASGPVKPSSAAGTPQSPSGFGAQPGAASGSPQGGAPAKSTTQGSTPPSGQGGSGSSAVGSGRPQQFTSRPATQQQQQPQQPQQQPQDAARLEALRQRQIAEREALIQKQREERRSAPLVQQPRLQGEQLRERSEQRRIQQQQRDIVTNRPQPPKIPPVAAQQPQRPPQANPQPQQQQQRKPPQQGQQPH